jgi:hypothetical protein
MFPQPLIGRPLRERWAVLAFELFAACITNVVYVFLAVKGLWRIFYLSP